MALLPVRLGGGGGGGGGLHRRNVGYMVRWGTKGHKVTNGFDWPRCHTVCSQYPCCRWWIHAYISVDVVVLFVAMAILITTTLRLTSTRYRSYLWCVQIIGIIMDWRSYYFDCTLPFLIIIRHTRRHWFIKCLASIFCVVFANDTIFSTLFHAILVLYVFSFTIYLFMAVLRLICMIHLKVLLAKITHELWSQWLELRCSSVNQPEF